MNQIEVKLNKSIYPIYDKYFKDIFIDGQSLDLFLDNIFPDLNIKGLVPPFDNWLMNKKDEIILWERILPYNDKNTILPVLICPDDQDYSCSVIVTNVINKNNMIIWKNFGFDTSYQINNNNEIGKIVNWFNKEIELIFDFDQYKLVVDKLKNKTADCL